MGSKSEGKEGKWTTKISLGRPNRGVSTSMWKDTMVVDRNRWKEFTESSYTLLRQQGIAKEEVSM